MATQLEYCTVDDEDDAMLVFCADIAFVCVRLFSPLRATGCHPHSMNASNMKA